MENKFSKSFINHTFRAWASRSKLNQQEVYLFKNYLKNPYLPLLEAGTGGGVLSFYLEQKLGFQNITAFDLMPEMIDIAKQKAKIINSNIRFKEANVIDLKSIESDNYFSYFVYMQQVLSMLSTTDLEKALSEAFRLGNSNSIYIFSFLEWDSRWYNPILSFNVNIIRFLLGRPLQKYYIPELRFNGKINYHFYKKDQHALYWGKKKEIIKKIREAGFSISNIYKEEEITKHKGTALYFICKK